MIKNIKKWALAVAIAIVFNLFVNYGLSTFYEAPKYEDYCTMEWPRGILRNLQR